MPKKYLFILAILLTTVFSIDDLHARRRRSVRKKQIYNLSNNTLVKDKENSSMSKAIFLNKYGDDEAALRILDEILESRPQDIKAIALKRDILDKPILKRADQVQVREGMINEVQQSWRRPSVYVADEASGAVTSPEGLLLEKLKNINIPSIGFSDMPLLRVIERLSILSVEMDSQTEDASNRGVNLILLDPSNTNPKVNIPVLRNLSLDRVLSYVTKSIGFEYYFEEDAVVVTPKNSASVGQLETLFFPVTRATVLRLTDVNQRQENKEKSNSKINSIFEEETAIKDFFQRSGINFDKVEGSGLAFDGTQLIITQTPRNLGRIKNVLHKYRLTQQVEIEAKFIEVQQGVLEELGFQWRLAKGHSALQTQTADASLTNLRSLGGTFSTKSSGLGGGQIISASGATSIPNSAPILPNAINLAASAIPFSNILGIMDSINVQAVIRALEQQTGSDLMSAPKLTVLSGKSAEIVVAQEFRYPQNYSDMGSEVGTANDAGSSAGVTITAGTPQNFVTRNVGVEMRVTPTVENDKKSINLRLEPKVTEFEGFMEYGGSSVAISGGTTVQIPSGFFQPIFSVRQIKTELTILDGTTVVMGGLTREEIKETKDGIPILSRLPLFGSLFRSKGETSQKRNLLIFVTANVISPGGAPAHQNFKEIGSSGIFKHPVIVTPQQAIFRR